MRMHVYMIWVLISYTQITQQVTLFSVIPVDVFPSFLKCFNKSLTLVFNDSHELNTGIFSFS